MKTLIIVLFTLLFSTAKAALPKHYVFLVHGISADSGSFGNMQAALTRETKGFDPHTNWKIINFNYQTGNYHKNIFIFAKELSDFIAENFKASGGINPEDKFSLIMHSQGGLIGLNFLIKAQMNDSNFHPELKNHLDAFITLGTPYWGANIASFATRMMPILSILKIPWPENFGLYELEDMSLASDFNATMRNVFMSSENQMAIKEITSQGRFLVFSGTQSWVESDVVVPIPAARLDFFYYKDKLNNSKKDVFESDFQETKMIDKENYIIVNALHISPLNQNKKFPAIASLPNRCADISFQDCDHPTYKLMLQHLFQLPRDPVTSHKLSSFAIELKINSAGKNIDREKTRIQFRPLTSGINLGKDIDLYNVVNRWTMTGNFRMYRTGFINSDKTNFSLGKVEMIVNIPGHEERKIIIPVKSAESTYVELEISGG